VSLLRIINTPARGIGRTTVEQIERYGREHGLNLWDSIGRMIDDEHLSTRSQSAGNVPQPDSGTFAGGQLFPAAGPAAVHPGTHRVPPHAAAGEDAGIRVAPGEPGRVGERGGGGRRARRNHWGFPGPCRAGVGSRRLRRGLAGEPDDAAQRQGAGVSRGIPLRPGDGPVPAQPVDGIPGNAGRRAAAVLRGDDARAEAADPHVGAVPAAVRRRRAGADHAFRVS
jgi:hypothetical protein